MEFGGPMSSKEAHRKFGEDLFFSFFFFGDHLILTEKTARISVKTFSFFGDHIIIWTKLQFTTPKMQHISAGPGPTFGSRRPRLHVNKNKTIIASKSCNSSWLPAILQKIEKTSDENYVWTLYSILHHYLFFETTWYSKKSILSIPKWGVQVAVRGHASPLP